MGKSQIRSNRRSLINVSEVLQWLTGLLHPKERKITPVPADRIILKDSEANLTHKYVSFDDIIGVGSDKYYRHIQAVPAATWNVQHSLGKRPSITILDDSGNQVEGQIIYIDTNNAELRFAFALSGSAECN
jgi:hypothetical protein